MSQCVGARAPRWSLQMTKIYMMGLLVALAGCDVGTFSAPITESESESESELELRDLFPDDAVLVGVTVAPDGRRYILDQRSGLYEISDSSATLVLNTTGLTGLELTDVVALDADRFALAAENDGFLFDRRTGTFSSFFCYLPAPPAPPEGLPTEPPIEPISISQALQLEGIPVKQRTESVAFNPDTRQLFAQPRTFRLDTGIVEGSELFVFGEGGGEPIQVLPFADTSFVAGGMLAAPGDRLILGAGNGIYELTLGVGLELLRELDASIDITGMARASNGDLWILDGPARRLAKVEAPGVSP